MNIFAAALVFSGDRAGFYQIKTQSGPRVYTLSEKDDGRTIRLKKGDYLVLKLKARFGTGYSWQVAVNDNKRLRLVSQITLEAEKNGDSGSETQVFRFTASQAGQFDFELRYVRVWEKEVAPLKTFRLKLRIGKS